MHLKKTFLWSPSLFHSNLVKVSMGGGRHIVDTAPHGRLVIKCRDVANWSAEYFWIITAPGSTCRASYWVSHLLASCHLVTVRYLCPSMRYPGEDLARVEWLPDSAGCFTLCFICKVGVIDASNLLG